MFPNLMQESREKCLFTLTGQIPPGLPAFQASSLNIWTIFVIFSPPRPYLSVFYWISFLNIQTIPLNLARKYLRQTLFYFCLFLSKFFHVDLLIGDTQQKVMRSAIFADKTFQICLFIVPIIIFAFPSSWCDYQTSIIWLYVDFKYFSHHPSQLQTQL